MILQRSCTEVANGNTNQLQGQEPFSLETFRDVPAYVLLGDPGAGKTTAFKTESKALGEKACRLTADKFLTYSEGDLPSDWQGKTLFIDGLDEVRVSAQGASEFRQIRKLLRTLGKPRFRLSCREADWLGANDQERLESVSPDSKVRVLRLNPLTVPDVEKILSTRSDVPDPRAFITTAQEKGVDGLLFNPLSLRMLADAVAGGQNWPESRGQTFEEACRRIVCEHDPVPRMATVTSSPPTHEQLLDAAGRLCAVQLIAGKTGYALPGQPENNEYPALDRCEYDYPGRLRLVINSKLFKGEGTADNRFTPVHRHIAEFLGARYLARMIGARRHPLPARRVIALLTGQDGAVVTEMRGLSAWLAALSPDARSALIERDPIGVGLYGDIREFSPREKRALLDSLKRSASRLDSVWKHAAFGPLATPGMEPVFIDILKDVNRDREQQMLTDFVLRVLAQGTPSQRLSATLLEVVRDGTRWPSVNRSALYTFMRIRNFRHGQDRTTELKLLLADIHTGKVTDSSDGELLGMLVTDLYPDEVTPSEVWSYFSNQENPEPIGRLRWLWDIVDNSPDQQVAELLDHFHQRLTELQPVLARHHVQHLPLRLLARGLKAHGDQLSIARLYDWLGVGEFGYGRNVSEEIHDIRFWLEQRPEIQKAIILEGLDRCPDSDDFGLHPIHRSLYPADLPANFGRWCLEQAIAKDKRRPRVAERLFRIAFHCSGDEPLSLADLRQHARKHERFKVLLERLLAARMQREEEYLKHRQSERTFTEERQQREEEWLAYVGANETALRENRAAPALLHFMAKEYFESPEAALNEKQIHPISPEFWRLELERLRRDGAGLEGLEALLGDDRQLIDAAVQGLLGVIDRSDLPNAKEIFDLRGRNLIHCLGWPYMAALEELERTASEEDPPLWDDRQTRKALAFYYCDPPPNNPPQWYRRLLAKRPETVADVQVQFAMREFRSGREHIFNLAQLAHDSDHTQVAKHASLPLLRAFPTRCKLKQLKSLDHLLWAGIQYADKTSLRELIEKKLSRKSMNDAQRAHWLAAAFGIAPEAYQVPLEDFVRGREHRSLGLAAFFCRSQITSTWLEKLGNSSVACFIRLVGGYVGPDLIYERGWRPPSIEYSRLIHGLIHQNLAASPDPEASEALDSLLKDPTLSAWHEALSQAQDSQRVVRRDADFRHPTLEQVCRSLNGGAPANAGDLAALVVDQLQELADVVRKGDTNAWRQYWNVDQYDRPVKPRPENSCRNTLLIGLQQRLQPQGIDARSEVQHANEKRTDICVSCDGFQVPVEIKRNNHRGLWSALRNQLIAQYTNHPGADGYGMYLVFWFGKEYTQAPPTGKRPETITELQERLKKEAKLSEAEERKISVHVIDVSKP